MAIIKTQRRLAGVNRHTVRHTGPCPWSYSFAWCLSEGQWIRDERCFNGL